MSKAQELKHAVDQTEQDDWQCRTCSSEAQENSIYCMHCEMYWDDVDNGLFDDDYPEDECPTCLGRGTVDPLTADHFCTSTATCPDCDGKGVW